MAHEYDKVFKENLENFFLPLFTQLLGLDISLEKAENIILDLQETIERSPDFLKLIETGAGKFILHLEIQSVNDVRMLGRMMLYTGLLYEKHKLPIRPLVLYVGKEAMNMLNRYEAFGNHFEYELIDIRNFSYQQFLASDLPEMVVLAILANFERREPTEVIAEIVAKLSQFIAQDARYKKHIRQLEIISRLRDLEPEILKLTKAMPLLIDYTEDRLYKQGKTDAITELQEENIKRMLLSGELTPKKIAKFLDVPLEIVKEIQERLKQK